MGLSCLAKPGLMPPGHFITSSSDGLKNARSLMMRRIGTLLKGECWKEKIREEILGEYF